MAPSPITEDYYQVLGVNRDATAEEIKKAYRTLALKLHPDQKARGGTTEGFQRLGQAYETLADEDKRRQYDLLYPSISRKQASAQSSSQHASSTAQSSELLNEATQIAALHKAKADRQTRWNTTQAGHEGLVFELQRSISKLEQDIANLASIAAAEAAELASKNSWVTWMLSPLYKQAPQSEEEKEDKERKRQERKVAKSLKERQLEIKKVQLQAREGTLKNDKAEFHAANARDDQKLMILAARARERQHREKVTKERLERERLERERQERQRKEGERLAKFFEEMEKARRQEQDAQERRAQEAREAFEKQQRQSGTRQSACIHGGWWDKVQRRTQCPECYDTWTYLLQCPSCGKQACPKCQRNLRPRHRRGRPRSPTFSDYWD